MKKILLLIAGVAAYASGLSAQCGDGINTVKVFTPGGSSYSQRLWSTASNWTPSGVPDCDDDVRIWNGIAYITSNVTVRDIRVFRQTTPTAGIGKMRIEGNYSVTCRNLVIDEADVESSTTDRKSVV